MRLLLAVVVAVLAPASVLAQPVSQWCMQKDQALASANNNVTTAQNALTQANDRAFKAWSELQKTINFNPLPGPNGGPPPGLYAYAEAHSRWQEANAQQQRAQNAFEDAMADKRQADALAMSCPTTP